MESCVEDGNNFIFLKLGYFKTNSIKQQHLTIILFNKLRSFKRTVFNFNLLLIFLIFIYNHL